MKLTNLVILALRGCRKEIKQRMADQMGISLRTLYMWINDNNDDLTKPSNVRIIKKELNLAEDLEILEDSVADSIS